MFYPMFRFGGQHVSYLMSFIGKSVRINRGGPESVNGKLIAVHADYIVVLTKEGIVYVNTAHIKSITESKEAHSTGRTRGHTGYIMAHSFNGVLHRLTKHFVQINQGGPEKVTGFIVEVGPDTLLLVSGKEVIRIPLFHIRTVSLAQKNGSRNGSSDDKSQDSRQSSQGQRSSGRNGGGSSQGRKQEGGSRGRQGGSRGHQGGRQGGSRGVGGSGGRKN
jgi:spore coat protein B